jgi:excisionase family DNA binding protein
MSELPSCANGRPNPGRATEPAAGPAGGRTTQGRQRPRQADETRTPTSCGPEADGSNPPGNAGIRGGHARRPGSTAAAIRTGRRSVVPHTEVKATGFAKRDRSDQETRDPYEALVRATGTQPARERDRFASVRRCPVGFERVPLRQRDHNTSPNHHESHRPPPRPLLVNIMEAAEILALSRSSIYQLIWNEQLVPIRIGRSVRLSIEQLEQFVSDRQSP